jgi:hypothetical protein
MPSTCITAPLFNPIINGTSGFAIAVIRGVAGRATVICACATIDVQASSDNTAGIL